MYINTVLSKAAAELRRKVKPENAAGAGASVG